MDAVLASCGDRAILLITHRPLALERMDEIVLMENGVHRRARGAFNAPDEYRVAQADARCRRCTGYFGI